LAWELLRVSFFAADDAAFGIKGKDKEPKPGGQENGE
jgi:hypothetical protein